MSRVQPPPPSPTDWWSDPLEVDRTLEGELPADALRAREAQIAADPALAERLAPRRAFLDSLRAAGVTRREDLPRRTPPGLSARVQAALAQAPAAAPTGLRWAAAAAAVLVLSVAAARWFDGEAPAEAMPLEVIRAVEAARSTADGPRTCVVEQASAPRSFPPVKEGALRVWRCAHDREGTVAKLYRPEDLPTIGYVAVAEEGAGRGPDIGLTEIDDMVVFDVPYGRQRHYLAVPASMLAEQRALTPGRENCVACHNQSRRGKANPHNIVKRSWQLR